MRSPIHQTQYQRDTFGPSCGQSTICRAAGSGYTAPSADRRLPVPVCRFVALVLDLPRLHNDVIVVLPVNDGAGQYCVVLFCLLQLYCVGPMAEDVKRSAVTRRATMAAAGAAACWSLMVCWMRAVMLVAAVSEYDEGQLFVLLCCGFAQGRN